MGGLLDLSAELRYLVVVDRDGEGYEVAVTRPDLVYVPTAAEVQYGEQTFGRLRTASVVVDGY